MPSNIDRTANVVFCWDNNDFAEETPSGSGTTHCTNGIIIQRQKGERASATPAHLVVLQTHRHRRSLAYRPTQELSYVAGARSGPIVGEQHFPVLDPGKFSHHIERARMLDQLYVLL